MYFARLEFRVKFLAKSKKYDTLFKIYFRAIHGLWVPWWTKNWQLPRSLRKFLVNAPKVLKQNYLTYKIIHSKRWKNLRPICQWNFCQKNSQWPWILLIDKGRWSVQLLRKLSAHFDKFLTVTDEMTHPQNLSQFDKSTFSCVVSDKPTLFIM